MAEKTEKAEAPQHEFYKIPAPVLAAVLDVLQNLPYKNVGKLMPLLMSLEKTE